MNRNIIVTSLAVAGLGLASSLSVAAQEQEDQEFKPNRDIANEPKSEPQTSMGERRQDSAVATDHDNDATQGTTPSQAAMQGGLSNMTADELEGLTVVTLTGEEVGEIGEVGSSPAHEGRVAIVEAGGFLGVGEKTIAIPLSELQKSASDEESVRTSMTRSTIESQPAFDDSTFTPDE